MGVVITGIGYIAYKLTSGTSSHYHSKLKHIKNKIKVPRKIKVARKIKNPSSSLKYHVKKGKKGNRHKLHVVSKVTRSISSKKYYSSNNKRSNNNSGLTKSKVAQIAYHDAYNDYLSTKNKERTKIIQQEDKLVSVEFNKMYRKYGVTYSSTKPPEGNKTKFLKGLYKFSHKHYTKGIYLINNGHILKGVCHISIALWSVDLGVFYISYELFPKEIFNKIVKG